jgi:hypothetical protein
MLDSEQFVDSKVSCNQEELLTNWTCPNLRRVKDIGDEKRRSLAGSDCLRSLAGSDCLTNNSNH